MGAPTSEVGSFTHLSEGEVKKVNKTQLDAIDTKTVCNCLNVRNTRPLPSAFIGNKWIHALRLLRPQKYEGNRAVPIKSTEKELTT
jgi:hypothetical protein